MHLQNGDLAPNFEALSDEERPVQLTDFRGKRIILFFYPKAGTSGCTTQACGFRDSFPQIEAANAVVLGISPDAPDKLAKWKAAENLPYSLLSDPEHRIADLYGTWGEKSMYGNTYMGIIRSHFIIDANGRIEDAQYKISPKKSIQKALKQLES